MDVLDKNYWYKEYIRKELRVCGFAEDRIDGFVKSRNSEQLLKTAMILYSEPPKSKERQYHECGKFQGTISKEDDGVWTYDQESDYNEVEIVYCPFCGAKL